MAFRLAALLVLATPSLCQTVRIFREIPGDVDQCVRPCLYRPDNPNADLGTVLDCGVPYKEECYCATDSNKAKLVSEHIDSCAQASCSEGSESQDAETMRSYYASYCMGNGYAADLMEEWYTGTVVEATGTGRDMWGWASATNTRAGIFDDGDRETTITAAPGNDKSNPDDANSACSMSVGFLFTGIPLLVVLFQQT
ncbi:hypothetical protein NM208_g8767 [Fusarium decemcellulare]|uniref:Uncharacterized protein n=1 Tax=Fusarium decemcellulare TaxID=57161 RepID=A0ACC1S419_9HYPO|nr:hypothetical protein NM208_g8767 [Fusarium decemcellulare]